jgi:glycosyltransferase involved in cell wall biosynthesis
MPDKQQRILIAVTSDLTTDQRVLKIAATFHQEGWDVMLVGRKLKNSKPLQTRFRHKRMKLLFHRSFFFYLEYTIRLFLFGLFTRYDYLYSNDTDTLPACFSLSRIRNKKLIFDAHELFPEVPELQHRKMVKRIWQFLEDLIFPHLDRSVTVCDSIAAYYNERYGISMQVVRNVPYLLHRNEAISLPVEKGMKVILYQGAINTGRGLEWVIDAMPGVDNAVLYIIGDGDQKKALEARVKAMHLESRVIFHGKVDANDLHRYTPSAHLGLCLLENRGLSYFYALPNRIFDYMHAGVPVLASPFPEIKAIVEKYKTGIITGDYTPVGLATTINKILKEGYPTEHFRTISKQFCWENEKDILLKLI